MKVNVEKIDNSTLVLEMEVEQEEVVKAFTKAYHRLAARVNIPGFRKGKVPRSMLEKRLGMDVLKEEALEILAMPAYMGALEEQKIKPVNQPKIEVVTLEDNQPFVFKVTVVPKPEVTLGQYKDLKVEKTVVTITDEQVEAELQTLVGRHAKMVVVDNAVLEQGDFAIIDFEGFVDGEPFDGGQGKAYPLEIGSGHFLAGFEQQLIGAKAGEEREVHVDFPAEYHAAALEGKSALFKVTVHDIKRKELPEVNDEFAKDVSEFDSLQELKADIKNNLEEAAQAEAQYEFGAAVLKLAVGNAVVDVPKVMVEERIDVMVVDLEKDLEHRGLKLGQYLAYRQMDKETLREEYRSAALLQVKTDLVLDAVAQAEGLKPTSEGMKMEMATMLEAGMSTKELSKIATDPRRFQQMSLRVLQKTTAKFIVDHVAGE